VLAGVLVFTLASGQFGIGLMVGLVVGLVRVFAATVPVANRPVARNTSRLSLTWSSR